MKGIAHVCFDKDGTLIDVHRYWSYNSMLRANRLVAAFGLDVGLASDLLDAMGIDTATGMIKKHGPIGYAPRPRIIEVVIACLQQRGIDSSVERIAEIFAALDRDQQESDDYRIELLPGVIDVLEYLRAKSVAVTIYTSDRKENVLRLLDALNLSPYVNEVVGGGCVKRSKPDPEGFLLACQRVGVPPGRSAYVGDTVDDLKMGMAGGASSVVGIATGLHDAEELAAQTDYVYANLHSFLEAFDRIDQRQN